MIRDEQNRTKSHKRHGTLTLFPDSHILIDYGHPDSLAF